MTAIAHWKQVVPLPSAQPSFAPPDFCSHCSDHLGVASLPLCLPVACVPMSQDQQTWPFLALFGLAGQTVVARGLQGLLLAEGELMVLTNRAPIRARSPSASRLLVVGIPQSAIGAHREGLAKADALRIPTREGIPSLVGQLLRGLASQSRATVADRSIRLAQHVAGLIALVCLDALEQGGISERPVTVQDAKEYIEQHLQDVDLTPAETAAALCVSARTLHRMFEGGSTVSGWIRMRRLEQCRLELGDRACDGLPVSRIGAKWGIWDAAHFSRLFRSAYGVSPATYRALSRGHGWSGTPSLTEPSPRERVVVYASGIPAPY